MPPSVAHSTRRPSRLKNQSAKASVHRQCGKVESKNLFEQSQNRPNIAATLIKPLARHDGIDRSAVCCVAHGIKGGGSGPRPRCEKSGQRNCEVWKVPRSETMPEQDYYLKCISPLKVLAMVSVKAGRRPTGPGLVQASAMLRYPCI